MSLLRHIRTITLIAGALVSASGFGQSAAEPSAPTATAPVSSPIYVPVTVSDFWQGFWRNYAPMPASSSPGPDDIAGWDATRTTMDAVISSFSDPKLAEHWGLSLQKGVRGGVP